METTEQNRRERELYFFKHLLEQSADPYHVISPADGFRFVYVNPAACRHYGRPEAELLTMRVPDWDPLFTLEKCEAIWNLLKHEGPQTFETVHRHADGHDIPVEVSLNYLAYEGMEYIGGSVRNITQRKRAQEALRESEARYRQLARERERLTLELQHYAGGLERMVDERTGKLREAVTDLEHMSYSIMHDMRAPLRAIQGYAAIIQQQDGRCLSAQSLDFLSQMIRATDRMDNLITDALNYSKTVRQELPLKPVDVAELLGGMLGSYPEFQRPKADICLEGEFPRVLGNAAGLTQCFSELLGNAVKFVEPGKLPRVRVRAECRGQGAGMEPVPGSTPDKGPGATIETQHPPMVRLWFEDNGIGIPRDGQQKIFDMFQRMHGCEYEGTGIGLALVHKVIERMGGRVGVESEVGQGSRFWIELRAGSC